MLARIATLFLALLVLPVFAADQEFAVTRLRPLLLRVKAPKKAKVVKLQVTDVSSGRVAQLELSHREKEWLQGVYLINFKEQASPKLQFQIVGQPGKLYLTEDASTSALELFSTENDYVEASRAKLAAAETARVKQEAAKKAASAREQALRDQQKAELDRLNQRIQEQERMKQEADEATRRAEALRKQEEMTVAEKVKRQNKAKELIAQADAAYDRGEYQAATQKYGQAVELDPSQDEMYYRYGVALYKTEEYNKSLAMLSMAEGGPQNKAEHNYYVGLNHLKLKETEKAHDQFVAVRDENNDDVSPIASYLAGNLEMQRKNYGEARTSFEYVLDHSKDPKLDEQSEAMLEQIDRIENFESSGKETMGYSLNAGFGYDGNVLSLATENLPMDAAAYRFSWGASLFYKFFQSFDSSFAGQIAYSDIYSMDKSLKASPTLQSTDPLTLTVSAPYKKQIEGANRAYDVSVTPSYSTLTMSAETDERKLMTTTTSLGADVSFPLTANWYSAYRGEVAQDVSSLSSAGTDDDQSSARYTLGTVQTKILDAKKGETLGGDIAYILNNAKGKNTTYRKAVLGVTYGLPGPYRSQANVRAEYMDMNYADNANGRRDSGFTLSTGALKNLGRGLSLSLGLQYVSNGSTVTDYKYDKMVVTSALTYSGVLIK